MPNIVVTSTTDVVKAVFNDVASTVGMKQGSWPRCLIHRVELAEDESFVYVEMGDNTHWKVAYNGTTYPVVDTVDAVAPTSNSDLYDKIEALIKC